MLIENNGSMSDKERLENIKYEFETYRELSESDEKWLINQVEKMESVEKYWKKIIENDRSGYRDSRGKLLKKIKRYEQALKDVVDNYGKISSLGLLEIVQKALKG